MVTRSTKYVFAVFKQSALYNVFFAAGKHGNIYNTILWYSVKYLILNNNADNIYC